MADKVKEAMRRLSQNIPKGGMPSGGGRGSGAAAAAGKAASALFTAACLSYGAYHSVYNVEGGHRAVVFNRITGMKPTVYGEGLNFNTRKILVGHTLTKSCFACTAEKLVLKNTEVLCK